MKPGDMIEWVYNDNTLVEEGEEFYSSTMERWVPIGEPSLLISITKDHYMWFNSKGLFHALVDDMDEASVRWWTRVHLRLFHACVNNTCTCREMRLQFEHVNSLASDSRNACLNGSGVDWSTQKPR